MKPRLKLQLDGTILPASTIGQRLREERERFGMSQTAFGQAGGVQKQAQINYESDLRSPDAIYLSSRRAGREVHGKPHARTAAYSQVPHVFVHSCAAASRGRQPRPQQPWHFSSMNAGDMERLVRRVRLRYGLAEVRRTWGAGMRQLQQEIDGGMR